MRIRIVILRRRPFCIRRQTPRILDFSKGEFDARLNTCVAGIRSFAKSRRARATFRGSFAFYSPILWTCERFRGDGANNTSMCVSLRLHVDVSTCVCVCNTHFG